MNLALIANQYDNDGVDIYFLGGEKFGLKLKVRTNTARVDIRDPDRVWPSQTANGVEEYLSNLRVDAVDYGEIKLAEGLGNLLGKYMDKLATGDASVKKCNFIVILGGRDGESFDLFSPERFVMPRRT